MNANPQVIFYLGPEGAGKTRLAMRTLKASARSLVVSLTMDPQIFRRRYGFLCQWSVENNVSSLHRPEHTRVVSESAWSAAVFSSQRYDRVFFHSLPQLFQAESSPLDLAISLARLAVIREADVIVRVNIQGEKEVESWQSQLGLHWNKSDDRLACWLNMPVAPVRYLRLKARTLLDPSMNIDSSQSWPYVSHELRKDFV